MKKAEIYASYGIEYINGKLNSPIGMIPELLVNGNAKLGKGVWTFSTLPGTGEYSATINGKEYTVNGTCVCDCPGCYAKSGFYRMKSTINALAIRTVIAREYPDFCRNAINAQIAADHIETVRIHASGDFFSSEYAAIWLDTVKNNPGVAFWTYTKNAACERLFDGVKNANIVKSIIPGCGLNYGHCDHILDTYAALESAGKSVHICRCGIDKNQHCTNCKGCSENEYVLFLEHSTDYKAALDPLYNRVADIVNAQQH